MRWMLARVSAICADGELGVVEGGNVKHARDAGTGDLLLQNSELTIQKREGVALAELFERGNPVEVDDRSLRCQEIAELQNRGRLSGEPRQAQ